MTFFCPFRGFSFPEFTSGAALVCAAFFDGVSEWVGGISGLGFVGENGRKRNWLRGGSAGRPEGLAFSEALGKETLRVEPWRERLPVPVSPLRRRSAGHVPSGRYRGVGL